MATAATEVADTFAAEGTVPYPAPCAFSDAISGAGSGPENARYLGRLFGLFILVEKDSRLFIIDQHAAHERILYEGFITGPVPRQELLVAMPFNTESPEDDRFLEEKQKELSELGIIIKKAEDEWLIEALPSGWKLSDRETTAEILRLREAGENMAERWAATLSCRAAVKDGDFLDAKTALALAEEAFTLPVYRCPHGRPIWFEISRHDLLRAVKRT
jgi:DNA mismatch repair protein MutL